MKVAGTKELSVVFGSTALDPDPSPRKKLRRKARKAAKKKGRRVESPDSSSEDSSQGRGGRTHVRRRGEGKRFGGGVVGPYR